MEAVAESDDALIEEYLEQGTLPEEHIVSGAKDGFGADDVERFECGDARQEIEVGAV